MQCELFECSGKHKYARFSRPHSHSWARSSPRSDYRKICELPDIEYVMPVFLGKFVCPGSGRSSALRYRRAKHSSRAGFLRFGYGLAANLPDHGAREFPIPRERVRRNEHSEFRKSPDKYLAAELWGYHRHRQRTAVLERGGKSQRATHVVVCGKSNFLNPRLACCSRLAGRNTSRTSAMLSKTLAIVVLAGALPHPVVLDRSVTLFTRPEEGEPIQKAAEDLAADFQVVLGRPKIIHRAEDSGPITIFIGESSSVPSEIRPSCLTAPESFSISLRASHRGHCAFRRRHAGHNLCRVPISR